MIHKPISEIYQDVIQKFHSGNSHLDNFIKQRSAFDTSIGKTYLCLTDNEDFLIGYYTLSMGSIEGNISGLPFKEGGSAHINCFAVDKSFQDTVFVDLGNGNRLYISDIMWEDCLDRIRTIRDTYIGAAYITLTSTEEGKHFYLRNDFECLDASYTFPREESEIGCIPMYYDLDAQ